MAAGSPSLGMLIRSRRLGWGLSQRHGCFVRMSDADGANTRIELCPVNAVPSCKVKSGFHRCWWEGEDVLSLIPWLRPVRAVHRYVCVVVDDRGTILRSET